MSILGTIFEGCSSFTLGLNQLYADLQGCPYTKLLSLAKIKFIGTLNNYLLMYEVLLEVKNSCGDTQLWCYHSWALN